jgi:sodium-dependent dicarboxylate transporter 2/3/5
MSAGSSFVFALVCGFMLAAAMHRWKMDRRAALLLSKAFGPEKPSVLLATLLIAGFCAMWTSSSLESIMLLPVLLAFRDLAYEYYPPITGRKPVLLLRAMALALSFGISLGGLANIIGSPLNQALYTYSLSDYGEHIQLRVWFAIGMTLFCIGLPVIYGLLRWRLVKKNRKGFDHRHFAAFIEAKRRELGVPSSKEMFLHCLVGATVLCWTLSYVLRFVVGPGELAQALSPGKVTVFTLLVILAIRFAEGNVRGLLTSEAIRMQPWSVVLYVAGSFALAYGLERTGAITVSGVVFSELLLSKTFLGMTLVFLSAVLFGNFVPTGVLGGLGAVFFAAVLIPIGDASQQSEIVMTLLPSATFLLPLGSTHGMIFYSTGLFTFRDFFRYGALVVLVLLPFMVGIPLLSGDTPDDLDNDRYTTDFTRPAPAVRSDRVWDEETPAPETVKSDRTVGEEEKAAAPAV